MGGVKEMDKIKLKPCPFCGGEAVIHINDGGVRVICKKCEASTPIAVDFYYQGEPTGEAVYKVVERWNRRDGG